LKSYHEPQEVAGLIAHKTEPYILIDVRNPDEYGRGHIPTAINIPVADLAARLPTPDRGALIIVYCASGMRSSAAAGILEKLGFTRVVDFGPVSRWTEDLVMGDEPSSAADPGGR
jgi:rhodanese-related sulfurtransferase